MCLQTKAVWMSDSTWSCEQSRIHVCVSVPMEMFLTWLDQLQILKNMFVFETLS